MKINLGPFIQSVKEYKWMLSFFTVAFIVMGIAACSDVPTAAVDVDTGVEYVTMKMEGYRYRAQVITLEGRDYAVVYGDHGAVAICPVTP